ncbi:MAG: hypothetical protein Q8M94_15935, partial [Ignavibacteria bacterium]|nr:hypothetical protein [Ignavibacteria bacterium]
HSGFKIGFGSFKVEQDKDLLKFYKDIVGIRNSNEELNNGAIKFIYSDNDKRAFAFESVLADKKTICVFNTGDNELTIKFDFPLIELYILNNDFESEKVHIKIYKPNEPIMIPAGSFGIFNTK